MEGHIYIHGEIIGYQGKDAEDYGTVSLSNVRRQVERQDEATSFNIHIHSPGGECTEGFAIHDYLKALNVPLIVRIEGLCASIATVIALSSDKRIMTENSDFMIHNPWGMVGGDRKEVQKYADQLESVENKLADFYANHVSINKAEILELMNEETWFSSSEALEFGFVTEIETELKAVALFKKEDVKSKNKKKMKDGKTQLSAKDKSWFKNALDEIKEIINPTKNISVQDANGVTIEFPEVEEGEEVSVGEKATIDGSPAEGEYTMPDGVVYTFADGVLDSIGEEDEEEEEEAVDVEALQTENERLETEVSDLKSENKALNKKFKKLAKKFQEFTGKFEFETKSNGAQNRRQNSGASGSKSRSLLKQD